MDKQELLNRYFEQSLQPEEDKALREILQEDAELQEEFTFRKNLQAGLHKIQRQADKELLREWESQLPSSTPPASGRSLIRRLLPIAAAIAGLLIFYWFYQQPATGSALYKQYYQPFPNIIQPVIRSQSDNLPSDSSAIAFRLYDTGRYEEARVYFMRQYATSGKQYALFYAAICQMEAGRMQDAIDLFKAGEFSHDSLGLDGWSVWYSALAYIRLEQPEPAKAILTGLSKQDHVQAASANALLKALK